MAKIVLEPEFHTNILAGAEALCAVAVPNFGPTGRTTIAEQKYDLPLVANSGRKILNGFALEDQAKNLGAVILRDAALKVSTDCGDGSLATVVLTDAMIRAGEKAIASGTNPVLLRKGMDRAMDAARTALKEKVRMPRPEDLKKLAVNIAKFEDVGNTVFEAISAVGSDGIITVQDSQANTTVLNIWDGVKYDYGLASQVFATDPVKKNVSFDDPFILLANYKITDIHDLLPLLNQCVQYGASLVIIAQEVHEKVLAQLQANVAKGVIRLAVANGPGHGDTRRRNMLALSAKTGAFLFEENAGRELKDCGLESCGRVERAVIGKEETLLQGFPLEDKESVRILRNFAKQQLTETKEDYEREKLETTLAILGGKIAEIISGGTQEYEMFERKYLAENTVAALKSALNEGVLPGGGAAYLLAIPAVEAVTCPSEDEQTGVSVVRQALEAPMRTLCANVGFSPDVAISKAEGGALCYDTVEETMCDPVEACILDPAACVLTALATAVSTAGVLLSSTAAVLSDKPEY